MKRAQIEIGREYAVRHGRNVRRETVTDCRPYPQPTRERTVWAWLKSGIHVSLSQVLMPWPQWLEQQEAKKAEREAIDRQREELRKELSYALHEKLTVCNAQVLDWDPERKTVTLSWADLARLLGIVQMPAPEEFRHAGAL